MNSIIRKATVVCASLLAVVLTSRGAVADYTREDITDRMAPGWPNSAKVYYWHEESPTHTGKAWAVEFPVNDSHFRFTTRLGRDNNTTADNRLARLNEMAEKLKAEGRNPIVAINGNFFTYPQDTDKETGKYLPINLYGSIMSDSRMLTGLGGTLLTESASHEFEFSTSRISSRGWPCDSQGRKIRNATGFYEPNAQSLKIKFERDNGGYKNLDSDRNYPRSLIGLRNDVVNKRQYLCFLVSDGRQPTWSGGVEDRDAVGMLVTLGCQTVAENDGGGSAGMWIKDLPVELQPRSGEVHSGFISRPDGGSPRTVAEGIFMTYEQGPFDSVHLRGELYAPTDAADEPYDTLEEAFRAVSQNDYVLIYNAVTVKQSCTNAQPCTLRAVRSANTQTVTVAEGAELFLKNALLENVRILAADGSGGTVKVPTGGKLTVGARVYDLRVENADANGFCMGTNVTESVVVDCRSVTEDDTTFGLAAEGISEAELDAGLVHLKHPTDPKMIAISYASLGRTYLRWTKPTVRVGARGYETLDDAFAAAKGVDGAVIEIIEPTKLAKPYVIPANCTITATNENARATPVEFASGAKLTVGAGVRVLFTNVVFTAKQGVPEVEVAAKGVAAVAGLADVGTLKLLKDSRDTSSNPPKGTFELAGPLTDDVRVEGASGAAIGDFVGVSSLTLEEAEASAGHVVNAADDELAGEAYEDGDVVKIRWAIAEVSDGNAAVRFISEDGAVTNNYKSLKMLFRGLKDSGQIELLEDCPLVEPATIPAGKSVVMLSAGDSPAVVKLPASGTWAMDAVVSVCGTLAVTNVVFDGDGLASGASSLSVFRVFDGGSFELGAAARIENVKLASTSGGKRVRGVVYVMGGGTFQMGEGSLVTGCSGGSDGSAAYLAADAAFNLFGGRITGCAHANGAAYASADSARIAVRGDATVTGNKTASGTPCNLKFLGASCLTLAGELTGTVGVNYGNADKKAFGVVASGGDSADHFVCDVKPGGKTLLGSESDGKLVWRAVEVVPPANVRVGGVFGSKYGTLEDAVAAARAGDTLTILAPIAVSSMPVRIDKKLTITASDPANVISRGTNGPMRVSSVARAIEVAVPGVVFKNVVLGDDDCAWPRAFVHVLAGGELTLGEGAVIRNVRAKSMMREGRFEPIGRSAAGVLVEGKLVMEDGATICNCTNVFSESMGGGVLASGPSAVFDFRGGTVTRCSAAAGGGVAVEKHATALVRDDGVILGNANGNLYVAAESPLEIADVFTGRIDYHEGVTRPDTETNIFADVTYDFAGDLEALAAGAIRFTNELTRACGVAVTNETGEAACYVWNTALADGPTYEKGGVRWTAVGEVPPQPSPDPGPVPPPVPPPEPPKWEVVTNHPTPIAFRSIDRVSDTEWTLVVTNRVEYCNYRLIWTKDLTKGFTSTGDWEHAVGEAAAPIWTTNVITTGGAWFWRAEGADGTNMVLKTEE